MAVVEGSWAQKSAWGQLARTRQQIGRLLLLVAVADALTITLAILAAWNLRVGLDAWLAGVHGTEPVSGPVAACIGLVWMALITGLGAYSPRSFGAGTEEFRHVFLATLLTAGSTGILSFMLRLDISRGFVLLTFFIGLPMLFAQRYAVRKGLHHARRHGRMLHTVVAVGGPGAIAEVAEVLNRESYVGYLISAACVPEGMHDDKAELPVPCLGTVEDTRAVCEKVGADTVLVTRGAYSSSDDLRSIAWDLEGSDIDLVVVPSLTDVAGPRIHMRPVAGLPLLHLEGPQADEAGGLTKRAFDFFGAMCALLVLSPVFLAVAALIKLDDGGPVFYRQSRIGLNGKAFPCLKFRSMSMGAEKREADLRAEANHDGALWKMQGDPRVTRVGSFLRRFSVDELPQLVNVLRGEMSLVGPRPQQAWEVETYTKAMRRRLLVRPGMTGLWQVSGRSSLPWSEAVRLDLYYVDNWSMVGDLLIIAKTVRAVLFSEGAY
ncbi:MAG TPA: sugar transferase [Nocardioidaceae bacterium]|nr:sugar transferase [Nocardioidaceae bacterium]